MCLHCIYTSIWYFECLILGPSCCFRSNLITRSLFDYNKGVGKVFDWLTLSQFEKHGMIHVLYIGHKISPIIIYPGKNLERTGIAEKAMINGRTCLLKEKVDTRLWFYYNIIIIILLLSEVPNFGHTFS